MGLEYDRKMQGALKIRKYKDMIALMIKENDESDDKLTCI